MSIISMQTVIARLCVDAKFRLSFLRNPDETLRDYELASDEVESIRNLDMPAVRHYSGSLIGKRSSIIKKWYSSEFRFLEERIEAEKVRTIVTHYCLENIRGGEQLGGDYVRGEFIGVLDYFRRLVSTKEIDLPGFLDLLEFDAKRFLMAMDPAVSSSADEFEKHRVLANEDMSDEAMLDRRPVLGSHARLHSSNFDVARLVEDFEEDRPSTLVEGLTLTFLFKRSGDRRVRATVVNRPLYDLLAMCDGKHAVREIVAAVCAKHAVPEAEEACGKDCLHILRQFLMGGNIAFVSDELGDVRACAACAAVVDGAGG